jgi:cell wall-associated NlpC family hydrolase
MVSWNQLQARWQELPQQEYLCVNNLNLYDSSHLETLATQAIARRQLRLLPSDQDATCLAIEGNALRVCLCEDVYPGWLAMEDLDLLELAPEPYQAIALSDIEISNRLSSVIAFARAAMRQPNHYLWGGTTGPNYDCSGLVQSAFAAAGIWLPRDAYQQEAFVRPIELTDVKAGDLVFFGTADRCTHVGIALGDGSYIHSSGKDVGRNGIGIDWLSPELVEERGDRISQNYLQQLRGVGRVVRCYTGD